MAELYKYQQQAVDELTNPDKHIVIAGTGAGKSAISLRWALTTQKKKWLVVTTASARDSKQWFTEYDTWVGLPLSKSLSTDISLEVISWQALAKWTVANWNSLDDYVFIFDELAKAKAGTSSARGRAFLQIAKRTECWAGFTATPGDRWIDFQAYFIAGGYVKNKTQFQREFCEIQTFKGYPEIVSYHNTDLLKRWWKEMTVCPDTSAMLAELPRERHYTHLFKPDPKYKTLLKTRTLDDGTFLDTAGAFCAACRKLCFTKAKQQWLSDYLSTLGTNTVLFYHFTDTGKQICEVAKKALPKEAKVWLVCGTTHDIPTADTIGKYDVVVCQWEAGSEALNLQFMHQWVAVEPTYRYSTAVQARGRIKRIGQQHKMTYHYLKCEKTIEEAIYSALKTKSDFAEESWVLN